MPSRCFPTPYPMWNVPSVYIKWVISIDLNAPSVKHQAVRGTFFQHMASWTTINRMLRMRLKFRNCRQSPTMNLPQPQALESHASCPVEVYEPRQSPRWLMFYSFSPPTIRASSAWSPVGLPYLQKLCKSHTECASCLQISSGVQKVIERRVSVFGLWLFFNFFN